MGDPWIFAVEPFEIGGVDGADKPIMDSGAVTNVCPAWYAEKIGRVMPSKRRTFLSATGEPFISDVSRQVAMMAKSVGGNDLGLVVDYRVAPVRRPILSVSEAVQKGKAVWFSPTSSGVCARLVTSS